MKRLRRAAIIAFCVHLVAGVLMALVLRRGLDTNPDLQDRMAFLVHHRVIWTAGWLTWTAAALAILYFYLAFAEAHDSGLASTVLLTVAAIGPDLAGQAIEIGVLPAVGPPLFLTLHRVSVMLSGYLANGLYSLTALILTWRTRRAYPAWVWSAGMAVGLSGLALSVAALMDSADGMFWTNAILVPAILVWIAGVGLSQ
jgi:hypothetical protein